jgi:hypothetical protein
MAYWWVSQNTNYEVVIEEGTLWTAPTRDGQVPVGRGLIKAMSVGDTVLHYKGPHIRAVSTVAEPWVDSARPVGYPSLGPDDSNDGWLVRISTLARGFELHRDQISWLIGHGAPGPLDKNGEPQQKYISNLPERDALVLLAELGLTVPDTQGEAVPDRPSENRRFGETDIQAMRAIRAEQGHLRKYLLGDKPEAACAICSRSLPADLLVAGHIKKRSECTDDERWNFESGAMLVCLLGCDSLFENGYIVVDESGVVRRGRDPHSAALDVAIRARAGRTCTAYNSLTASSFKHHAQGTLAAVAGGARQHE